MESTLLPSKRPFPGSTILSIIQDLKEFQNAEEIIDSVLWETMGKKAEQEEYEDFEGFADDMRRALSLAYTRFQPDSVQYENAAMVAEKFERLVSDSSETILRSRSPSPIVLIELTPPSPPKPLKPMTRKQKMILANHIHALPPQCFLHIIHLVKEHRLPGIINRFEFDLNTLPLALCYELKKYVSKCRRLEKKTVQVSNLGRGSESYIDLEAADDVYLPAEHQHL
jgi:hypothetical protein